MSQSSTKGRKRKAAPVKASNFVTIDSRVVTGKSARAYEPLRGYARHVFGLDI